MKTNGFTLIEIIVSLAIFSVVAVIAIGALVRVTSANRQAQAIQSGVNNISFVLDDISREMRVGTGYGCYYGSGLLNQADGELNGGMTQCANGVKVDGPSTPDTLLTFTGSDGYIRAYLFSTPNYTMADATTTIYAAKATAFDEPLTSLVFNPITAQSATQSVNITGYQVGILGGTGTSPYGAVYINVKGYVGIKVQDQSIFDVETVISERSQS
jgi:prepilin-type N-terminal cleavage/methylation domain-containing protein